MNKIFILIFLVLIMCLPSCNTAAYCFKIEGSAGKYGIDDASIELCRDPVISEKTNSEVYTSNTGQQFVLMNTKYVERANKIISEANKQKIESNAIKQFTENVD